MAFLQGTILKFVKSRGSVAFNHNKKKEPLNSEPIPLRSGAPTKGLAVFKSLSEGVSSDPRRHADAPVHTYSTSKPNVGANLGKIIGYEKQLDLLLTEINDNDISRVLIDHSKLSAS